MIASEWDGFARSLPGRGGLSASTLRDHADDILAAIADDMDSPQSASEQAAKAVGRGKAGAMVGVGRIHAVLRTEHGFTLEQIVAEFRALRASVLRLWLAQGSGSDLDGVVRFNEAIDEVLAESTTRHEQMMAAYRERFVAVLGHDLRTPLSAIVMAATGLQRCDCDPATRERMVSRIAGSARRMGRLVDDLRDVALARFGGGLPIARAPDDAGRICRQLVAELEGLHADGIRLEERGDLRGQFDGDRLVQMLSNLVDSAIHHGARGKPISIVADGQGEPIVLIVHSEGRPIPAATIAEIFFEPFVIRRALEEGEPARIGLGLYIAHEIAVGHGGAIDVTSSEREGTTFRVRLPRRPPQPVRGP